MPVFEYKGKTLAGAQVNGSLKANSKEDLERVLRQNRILVSSISKKAPEIEFKIGTGIKKVEVSRFTRQFATMIGAGLPMVQCLDILAQQSENKELRKIIADVKDGVQGGATLSDAMARHPKVFDPLYTNLVEAGEVVRKSAKGMMLGIKEKDLKGHFEVGNGTVDKKSKDSQKIDAESGEKSGGNGDKAAAKKLKKNEWRNDVQVLRAVELLQGWQVFKGLEALNSK